MSHSDWRERLSANPSRMETELAIKLQDSGVRYQTRVEIPITTVDFYLPTEPRPLLVFVDGRVHFGKTQMIKDKELRSFIAEEGIQSSRIILQQLFRQETRRTVPTSLIQSRKRIEKENNDVAVTSSS